MTRKENINPMGQVFFTYETLILSLEDILLPKIGFFEEATKLKVIPISPSEYENKKVEGIQAIKV